MVRFFSDGLYTLCLVFALVCAGCAGSAPSRFYTLSSLKAESAVSNKNYPEQRINIAVGPLRIPDYLDRPQIVTRSGMNELSLAESDRWAGSLERDTVRAVVENLSVLLPADLFQVIPWVSASESIAPSAYRIEVNILRFEGTPGESAHLKAQWAVFHREKGLLLRRESVITEDVQRTSYGAIVTALSNALARLSRDIADVIITL